MWHTRTTVWLGLTATLPFALLLALLQTLLSLTRGHAGSTTTVSASTATCKPAPATNRQSSDVLSVASWARARERGVCYLLIPTALCACRRRVEAQRCEQHRLLEWTP